MRLRPGTKLVILGLLVAVLFYVGYVVRTALLLIFISIVFAIIFSPWVAWIQRRRIHSWSPGRGAAILILLAAVLIAITADRKSVV